MPKLFVRIVVKGDQYCLIARNGPEELKRVIGSSGTTLTGQARHLATLDHALSKVAPVWRGRPTVVVITVRDRNVMALLRGEMRARKLADLLSDVRSRTARLAVHYVD